MNSAGRAQRSPASELPSCAKIRDVRPRPRQSKPTRAPAAQPLALVIKPKVPASVAARVHRKRKLRSITIYLSSQNDRTNKY